MTNQMVSRFRVKKLSPKHPLPIYKEHELPDLADATNIQRAVPQIETGVEKEEEEEVRLISLLGEWGVERVSCGSFTKKKKTGVIYFIIQTIQTLIIRRNNNKKNFLIK